MRIPVLAILAVAASAAAFAGFAQQTSEKMHPDADMQQQQAAPSEQTSEKMQAGADKGLKASDYPNGQLQREADGGAKTRNSGDSGYVADQDKPGASAHPPGQSEHNAGSSTERH